MGTRELTTVPLKAMGLYWSVQAVLQVPNLLALRSAISEKYGGVPNAESVYTSELLTAVFLLGLGVTLLIATGSFVRRLVAEPAVAGAVLGSPSLQAVGLSLLGAWLLLHALPAAAASGVVVLALSKGGQELERADYLRRSWPSFLQTGLEVALGLWVFFNASGVAVAWHGNRRGHGKGSTSSDEGSPS